ncbi:MAG: hypothetical protein WBQ25_19130 [Nitrososphaeraceae archaeon]
MNSDPASFVSESMIDSNRNRLRYSKFPNDGNWNVVHEPKFDKQKITYLNHCPEKQCSRYYVDTLVGRYYFICLDEHHDGANLEGGNN